MNVLVLLTFGLLSLMAGALHAQQDSTHLVNVGYTQQSQTFSYSTGDTSLTLQGYSLLYQYGINDWRISVDYNLASDAKANNAQQGEPQYGLQFETSGVNLFAEYNWPSSWLAVGIGKSQDDSRYQFNDPDPNPVNRINTRSETLVDYRSLTLDSGYIYVLSNGQWIVSGSLIQQLVEEKSHYHHEENGTKDDQVTNLNENGTLASMGLTYGHYFALNEHWQLYLSAGLRRQITIAGNGRTTTHYRTPLQNNQAGTQVTSSELESISQSASTTHQLQFSAYHNKGSISFDVSKLHHQALSEAYISVTGGIVF